jgi:hypothetical protein
MCVFVGAAGREGRDARVWRSHFTSAFQTGSEMKSNSNHAVHAWAYIRARMNNHTDWIYSCRTFRTLAQINSNEFDFQINE